MTDTNIVSQERKPPLVVLRERLLARESELKAALTDIKPDHFIRAVTTAAQLNPEIQACTFQSLWLACMKACRDGLLPDGVEGAIVPYKSNATWIPMYQGLLKRFRQSGECKWIGAEVVRIGETFEHWIDEGGPHFKHVPLGNESDPVTKVYAAAITKDGAFYVAVMSISEINKIKAMSKASRDDSPWKVWPGEMMKKTALRRLSKLLPSGRDFFEDDEDMVNKLPEQPQIHVVERAPGAVSALDQFAGMGKESDPMTQTEGGEISRTADTVDIEDPLSIAYERGQIARKTGAPRRAIPGEYREEANKAEADAWQAGYDGKEFTNPSTGEVNGKADG